MEMNSELRRVLRSSALRWLFGSHDENVLRKNEAHISKECVRCLFRNNDSCHSSSGFYSRKAIREWIFL